MVSSFSIFFIVAFYFYYKQHYEKLIPLKLDDVTEREQYLHKLKRKLMIFPVGVGAIILLYAISFTLMNLYPDTDVDVKSSRRVVDVVAALMFVGVFIWDKQELDRRLRIKKKVERPLDKNEPGIDIPQDLEI